VCGTDDADLFALPKGRRPALLRHLRAASPAGSPQCREAEAPLVRRGARSLPLVVRARDRRYAVLTRRAEPGPARGSDAHSAGRHARDGALHNTARFLGLSERLRYSDKLTLVLNRANSGIGADVLQRTLGIPVGCVWSARAA